MLVIEEHKYFQVWARVAADLPCPTLGYLEKEAYIQGRVLEIDFDNWVP